MDALSILAGLGLGLMVAVAVRVAWAACVVPRAWFCWAWWRVSMDWSEDPPPSWEGWREGYLAAIEEERVLNLRIAKGEGPWGGP